MGKRLEDVREEESAGGGSRQERTLKPEWVLGCGNEEKKEQSQEAEGIEFGD